MDAALAAFAVAAVVIVALAFAAAFVAASAQEATAQRMRAAAPLLKRWGGAVLVVVGVWFVALGVFAEAFSRLFPV